jgi:hypothetical protein
MNIKADKSLTYIYPFLHKAIANQNIYNVYKKKN